MKTDAVLHFMVSSTPPTSGPTIEPTRPIPSAQPTPGGPDRGRIEPRGQRIGGDLAADDAEAGDENRHA